MGSIVNEFMGAEIRDNVMDKPQVAVCIFLFKDEKILMGKRKGVFGKGTYALPGGKMEGGETFLEACKREVMEETGIEITEIDDFAFVNDIQPPDKYHYINLFFIAEWDTEQEPTNKEPEKCEGWEWHDAFNMPEPLYPTLKKVVNSYCVKRTEKGYSL